MWALETTRGSGWLAAGRTLTPIARSFRLRLPGLRGGLAWGRPAAIEVEEPGGRRLLKVRDRTRQIQWTLLGIGLVVGLLIRRSRRGT